MKIFLGYPREQLEIAEEVYAFLRRYDHDVWFDQIQLHGADEWDRKRKQAQIDADFAIHIFSKELNIRKSVAVEEIRDSLAQSRKQPFGKPYLLVIRGDDTPVPMELSFFQYINCKDQDFLGKILSSLKETEKFTLQSEGTTMDTKETSHQNNKEIIEFSDVHGNFSGKGEYFRYKNKDDIYWEFVNSKLAAFALEEIYAFKADSIESIEDDIFTNRCACELLMEEFYSDGEIISIRVNGFFDSGGAHPNYWIQTLNFMGQKFGLLSIENLLNWDDENALKILEYCERIMAAEYPPEDAPLSFGVYKNNINDVWALISQFNINKEGITINFSPYDVLPFVFGSHNVLVPWRVVDTMVNDRFKEIITN